MKSFDLSDVTTNMYALTAGQEATIHHESQCQDVQVYVPGRAELRQWFLTVWGPG